LHGAPGNRTSQTREVMTVIWFADGTRVLAPDNANRHRDLARWLNGIRPGELAAGPLNPVVFDRTQCERCLRQPEFHPTPLSAVPIKMPASIFRRPAFSSLAAKS
jgi:hypothetical protein